MLCRVGVGKQPWVFFCLNDRKAFGFIVKKAIQCGWDDLDFGAFGRQFQVEIGKCWTQCEADKKTRPKKSFGDWDQKANPKGTTGFGNIRP